MYHVPSLSSQKKKKKSFNGVPQGDPLSPLLYSMYTADFPKTINHVGLSLGNVKITYLMYADDMVLLAELPHELQFALDNLHAYAMKYNLTVNAGKTKCMVFYKGYCPPTTFIYNGKELENCNSFTYLGVVFTTRLAASKHVEHVISKCNAKVGYLFAKLPMKNIPLSVALDVFNIFVMPAITYALPIWYPDVTDSSKSQLNSLFTKFLKRHLGLPLSC
jgi:hypothetical protein